MKRKRWLEYLITAWAYVAVSLVLFIFASLLYFIASRGIQRLNLSFLLENPSGFPLGSEGGIKGAIVGSLLLMLLAMALAALLGLAWAIYLAFYNRSSFISTWSQIIIHSAHAVPSVLLGLFGYGFFIVTLDMPRSLLTAGLTLGLLIFPYVAINTLEIFRQTDVQMLMDSQALGVDRTYMIRKLLLPAHGRDIGATLLTAGSYAMGATAPLILTGVVLVAGIPSRLTDPVMALPYHLNNLLAQSVYDEAAYATALVLLLLLLGMHLLSQGLLGGGIRGYIKARTR